MYRVILQASAAGAIGFSMAGVYARITGHPFSIELANLMWVINLLAIMMIENDHRQKELLQAIRKQRRTEFEELTSEELMESVLTHHEPSQEAIDRIRANIEPAVLAAAKPPRDAPPAPPPLVLVEKDDKPAD